MSLRNSLSVLAVALVAAAGLIEHAAGQSRQAPSEHHADVADAPPAADPRIQRALAQLSPQDRALAEQQRLCPVTGDPLGSMGKPIKLRVESRDVFVCCAGCVDTLRRNPAKYLAKLEQPQPDDGTPPVPPLPITADEDATYTCPMHPQIQWPRPDECPLCGMGLVLHGADRHGMSGTPPAHGRMPMGAAGGVMGEQDFIGRNDFLPDGPPTRWGRHGGCRCFDMAEDGPGGSACAPERRRRGPGRAADRFAGGFAGYWDGLPGCRRGGR